jgi:hypothetical protein
MTPPSTNHTRHQKQNPSRETVPLNSASTLFSLLFTCCEEESGNGEDLSHVTGFGRQQHQTVCHLSPDNALLQNNILLPVDPE